ncbi:hypothetical protein EV356DRAFT_505658 [Viridothelium virens]|uniref:Uncharacterized protein n=1 Tax=Viridothelium virens TaxID=1048519 RepID=A0A6A6H300_VIRVR|nr:hypothetical protein EV356DRAFT_505658 [Viridothelium virens]
MSHPQLAKPSLSDILSRLPQSIPISPQKPDAALTPIISSLQLHPTIEALLHLLHSDLPSAHFLCRHMQAPPAVEGMLLHSILHRIEGDWNNSRAWVEDVGSDQENTEDREHITNDVGEKSARCRFEAANERSATVEGEKVGEGQEQKGRGSRLLRYVYESVPLRTSSSDYVGGEPVQMALDLISSVEAFRTRNEGSEEVLKQALLHETRQVLDWCVHEFGEGSWGDVSSAWVRPEEKVRKIGEEMVSGEGGWREF